MPVHDWKRARPGLFHHFHQRWTVAICDALNEGRLPKDYYALIEQHAPEYVPDVLTLQRASSDTSRNGGAIAVADAPPRVHLVTRASEEEAYAARGNRITVRESEEGELVAVIEVVSPGNKHSKHSAEKFVEKTLEFLTRGVSVLIVDLHPPTPRDPQGIHKLIWDELRDEPFELPPGKRLTLVAYTGGTPVTAYVEPIAVGEPLPDMPVFLDAGSYILAPLEATYDEAWSRCPVQFKEDVLKGGR